MSTFVVWHKKYIEYWKIKLNLSNYGILWIAFIKGLIIGLLVYHFIINSLIGGKRANGGTGRRAGLKIL